jgi:hypothetical protein
MSLSSFRLELEHSTSQLILVLVLAGSGRGKFSPSYPLSHCPLSSSKLLHKRAHPRPKLIIASPSCAQILKLSPPRFVSLRNSLHFVWGMATMASSLAKPVAGIASPGRPLQPGKPAGAQFRVASFRSSSRGGARLVVRALLGGDDGGFGARDPYAGSRD